MKIHIDHELKMISWEAETDFEKEWIQQFSEYEAPEKEYYHVYWHYGNSEDEPVMSKVFLVFAKSDKRLAEIKD